MVCFATTQDISYITEEMIPNQFYLGPEKQ